MRLRTQAGVERRSAPRPRFLLFVRGPFTGASRSRADLRVPEWRRRLAQERLARPTSGVVPVPPGPLPRLPPWRSRVEPAGAVTEPVARTVGGAVDTPVAPRAPEAEAPARARSGPHSPHVPRAEELGRAES